MGMFIVLPCEHKKKMNMGRAVGKALIGRDPLGIHTLLSDVCGR